MTDKHYTVRRLSFSEHETEIRVQRKMARYPRLVEENTDEGEEQEEEDEEDEEEEEEEVVEQEELEEGEVANWKEEETATNGWSAGADDTTDHYYMQVLCF